VSDSGVEFATALPRGTALTSGDRLILDDVQMVVEVVERAEPVLIVRPGTPAEWALYAYHIGNGHKPMMICTDAIVCASLPGIEQVLRHHGIPFERGERPFTPVGQLPDHRHAVSA
jgi:urease accessory protein UreE